MAKNIYTGEGNLYSNLGESNHEKLVWYNVIIQDTVWKLTLYDLKHIIDDGSTKLAYEKLTMSSIRSG